MRTRARLALAAELLLCFALLGALVRWQLAWVGDFKIDDAFITFSFSKNLALGHGPIYAHGARVEGYSNFLWMLLVAGPLALFRAADPFVVARALTVPFAALLGWATFDLARGLGEGRVNRVVAWLALALLLADTDLVVAAVCGLETLPYAALLAAGAALYLRGRAGSRRARALVVPCFVAAALLRIDGFLPLAFVLAVEIGASLLEHRFDARALARWAGPGIAVYGLWFLWRWHYYGLPLPTTYYAKALIRVALPDRGREHVLDFWWSTGFCAALPFTLVALLGPRRKEAIVLALFVGLHSLYVARVGGDWMPFWRFFAPIVPLVVVLVAWGAEELVRRSRRLGRVAAVVAALGALMISLWVAKRVDSHSAETDAERDKLANFGGARGGFHGNIEPMARMLGLVARPGERLVSDYAGAMAYYTDADVIDMWGLANREIALFGTTEGVNPIWGRTCPACIGHQRPELFHVMDVAGSPYAFRDRAGVQRAIFQSGALSKYVDFSRYAAGRVWDRKTNRAVFFLELRGDAATPAAREVAPGIFVDYPFERRATPAG